MRIRIVSASGRCAIDDRFSLRDVVPNMDIDTHNKPHIILTGPGSSVKLTADGNRMSVGPTSMLLIHQKTALGRLEPDVHDMRIVLGKIWNWIDSKVGRGERIDDEIPNAVVGIRG